MLGFLKRLWTADAMRDASDTNGSCAHDTAVAPAVGEAVDRYFEQRVVPLQLRVLHVLERRLSAVAEPVRDIPDATPAMLAEAEIEFMLGYWDEQRSRLNRELADLLGDSRAAADRSGSANAIAGLLEARFSSARQELAHKGRQAVSAALAQVADTQDAA